MYAYAENINADDTFPLTPPQTDGWPENWDFPGPPLPPGTDGTYYFSNMAKALNARVDEWSLVPGTTVDESKTDQQITYTDINNARTVLAYVVTNTVLKDAALGLVDGTGPSGQDLSFADIDAFFQWSGLGWGNNADKRWRQYDVNGVVQYANAMAATDLITFGIIDDLGDAVKYLIYTGGEATSISGYEINTPSYTSNSYSDEDTAWTNRLENPGVAFNPGNQLIEAGYVTYDTGTPTYRAVVVSGTDVSVDIESSTIGGTNSLSKRVRYYGCFNQWSGASSWTYIYYDILELGIPTALSYALLEEETTTNDTTVTKAGALTWDKATISKPTGVTFASMRIFGVHDLFCWTEIKWTFPEDANIGKKDAT